MIKVFPNIEKLNEFAANKFAEICAQAIKERGRMTVALSGGSTPKALFAMLAGQAFRDKIEWSKVYFFFGDERNVFPDQDESNYKMARENLFEPLQIADQNIYRWQTELEMTAAIAENYTARIDEFFNGDNTEAQPNNSLPRFDLIFLGMGADGHTASLFPGTKALQETEKIVCVNYVEKLNSNRLTFTFPLINNAANIIFLVAGADKADALHEVLNGAPNPEKFPSQSVKPQNGELCWLIDEKAGING